MGELMRVPIDRLSPEVGYYGGGAAFAKNLWPGPSGWLSVYEKESASGLTPVLEKPKAVFQTSNLLTGQRVYVVTGISGTGAFVYDADTSMAVDIGPTLTYSEYGWTFLEFGPDLILNNFDNPVKRRAAHAGAMTNLITSASPPQAFTACVCRSHLVLGNTFEGATSYVQRVRWSERDNAANFLAAESTRAGYVDLTDELGGIVRVVGGDDVIVLKQNGIQRLNFVGGAAYFERETISRDVGCAAWSSVVELGGDVYFLGKRGFYVLRAGRRLEALATADFWRQLVRPAASAFGGQWEPQWEVFAENGALGAVDSATGSVVFIMFGRQDNGDAANIGLAYSPESGAWGAVYGWMVEEDSASEHIAIAPRYWRDSLVDALTRRAPMAPGFLTGKHFPRGGLIWALGNAGGTRLYTAGTSGTAALPWTLRTGALMGTPGQVRKVRLWAANQNIGLGTGHESGYPTCRVIACNDPSVLLHGQANSATGNAGAELAANGFFAASSTSRDADGWFYFDTFTAQFFQFEFSGQETREIVRLEAVEIDFAAAGESKRSR